ncbi:hypothetical protein [Mobiluncus mulieris]|uniref:Uncharacterized protein n=1 Tax=Mobiluncus mulieris TaxID=2052 RepID=A0A7Y0U2J8_9ACTO|nr:hypothetical protein [Mobiluncus mulieris]NMW65789.1 hypothetical protein [Mobiluncus mulieris]NMX04295.1 hypothetical protein [Mobiluncus mulieris]NMX12350.1 hypothetical protein [Mobiluncus mulieris]
MSLSEAQLQQLADDFEAGWSEARLQHAKGSFGPGLVDFLPAFLYERLQAKAREQGKGDFEVIQDALKAYLIPA